MTAEQQVLADVRAEIEKLPRDQREQVMNFYSSFKALAVAGGVFAACAIALLGAEMTAEE